MRCKVGDLAVVIRSAFPANVGRLVTVVAADRGECDWEVKTSGSPLQGISRLTGMHVTGPRLCLFDNQLRPIRDQEGTDEMRRNLLLEID